MKIYEVIDFEPHDTNRPLYRSSHNIQNKGYMSLGNPGAFGDAFYNPDLPKRLNQVVKVGMAGKLIKGKGLIEPVKNIENDGYLYWIKATRHLNNRFVPAVMNFVPSLMINDWAWWEANEREIYNWMTER